MTRNAHLAEVFPPGKFIQDEMDARGWDQGDLSDVLGRPPKAINEILSGKRAITPETAVGLGEAFGLDPMFWLKAENAYRLSLLGEGDGEVAGRAKLHEIRNTKRKYARVLPVGTVIELTRLEDGSWKGSLVAGGHRVEVVDSRLMGMASKLARKWLNERVSSPLRRRGPPAQDDPAPP